MIREADLQEAIAECTGKRNPDANTCIKLAAYYIILNEMYPKEQPEDQMKPVLPAQSYAAEPEIIDIQGDSEFAQVIRGQSVSHIMPVLDELMDTLQVLHPRLYDGVMRRLKDL